MIDAYLLALTLSRFAIHAIPNVESSSADGVPSTISSSLMSPCLHELAGGLSALRPGGSTIFGHLDEGFSVDLL